MLKNKPILTNFDYLKKLTKKTENRKTIIFVLKNNCIINTILFKF